MKFEKLTNSLWKLQVIGWLIYFTLMFLSFISQNKYETWFEVFLIKVQRTFFGFILSCILWKIYQRVFDRNSFGKSIAISLALSIVFGIFWTAFQVTAFTQIIPNYDWVNGLQYQPRNALTFAVTLMAWSAIYLGITYWKQMQKEQENALNARVLAENAQLEMLRYQVNPHFLFNAMNSIRASIDEDKNRAKLMVTQLSEFLRHSLLNGETKEILLRDELEAVENYLAIEKIRFEEDLVIEFDIDEKAKDFKVPGFLLNPLVENAIKHGFQTSPKTLTIKTKAKLDKNKLTVEIANSGKLEMKPNPKSTNIGLKNIKERLEALFPERSFFELFEQDGFVVARIIIDKN